MANCNFCGRWGKDASTFKTLGTRTYCSDRAACLAEGQEWAAKFGGSEGSIVTKVEGELPEAPTKVEGFDPLASLKHAARPESLKGDPTFKPQVFDPHASLKRAY